MNQRRID